MIQMTSKVTMLMSKTNCVYGVTIIIMIKMIMRYRSVILFIPFGVIMLTLMINCCSLAR